MNARSMLAVLMALVLVLAACGDGGAGSTDVAPADTPTPLAEATSTPAVDTTTMTGTEGITGTEAMTGSAGMTETEGITGTEAMTTTGAAMDSAEAYNVELNPADFVAVVDNPYFPLIPGSKYIYETQMADGVERVEFEVLTETKEVMGITATTVRDTVTVGDELIEDTFDWFAQDKEGNVWYLGEDVTNYENGQVKDKAGSWEAGVDGAMAGIVMFADPAAHIGETYRQEYYKGEAEDMADLLSVSESVTVPYGSFDNVVQTFDHSPLDPDLQEHKFYAEGIGSVKVINLKTGEEEVLVEFTAP